LAIVPSGPDFSVLPRRESVAGLQHVEAHEKKIRRIRILDGS
jgi:hypothetical protein